MATLELTHMAERMALDPDFIAYWFQRWCELYGRAGRDLMRELRCDSDTIVHISLCWAPKRSRANRDITDVALRFGVDPIALAWVICLCQPTAPKRVKPITPI